jgi:hypothetical protein
MVLPDIVPFRLEPAGGSGEVVARHQEEIGDQEPRVTGGVAFEPPPVLALPNAARAEDD